MGVKRLFVSGTNFSPERMDGTSIFEVGAVRGNAEGMGKE